MSRVLGSFLVAGLLLTTAAAAAASPAVSSAGAEGVSIEAAVGESGPAAERGVRDAAAMLLVGTALLGLATAVRRSA